MTTAAMRKQLMAYLADADDKKIKGLYSLLEDNLVVHPAPALTKDELEFLRRERELHLSGKSKSYSWGKNPRP